MFWTKRSIVAHDRVQEISELYESLGFEVKIKRYKGGKGQQQECDVCYDRTYYVIYTRKKRR